MDATTTAEHDTEAPAEVAASDAMRSTRELFRYSRWLHVGSGAQGCEHATDGACGDPLHFHAWCRLPNQLQHQDIRDRSLAAKARKIRQLRDPETDGYVILESDLAEVQGDRAAMIDELVAKEWWKRHLDAMGDVEEAEEYEHIERDRERFRELQELAPDKRPHDEFGELERTFEDYNAKVERRRTELERPVREAVEGLTMDELVAQVRDDRIASEGSAAFMDTYAKWQWVAGTFTTDDSLMRRRRFDSVDQLVDMAPEVIEELRVLFGGLEQALQRGQQGN